MNWQGVMVNSMKTWEDYSDVGIHISPGVDATCNWADYGGTCSSCPWADYGGHVPAVPVVVVEENFLSSKS